VPSPGVSWQWQLQGAFDLSVDADLYVVDLVDISDEALAQLRMGHRQVVCNFSAGTAESYRQDVDGLPIGVLGNTATGRTNETWLDVRATSVRELMAVRMDRAASRGCTGVLPDSVDVYGADTGFPIGIPESLDYLSYLSTEAHRRNLAIGLSNAAELAANVQPDFDFVVAASCLEFDECGRYRAFFDANKAVLHVEFVGDIAAGANDLAAMCQDSNRSGYRTIVKLRALDAWRLTCE
jgi:hypothetical protein